MPEHEPMGACAISIRDNAPAARGLVDRARGGDFAAYEGLYHQHVGRIYAICLRMTGNSTRAEDLTQQAFIRAWERLQTFRGDNEFGAWLHRIAVNVVLADRRSGKRRAEQQVEDLEATSALHAAPTMQAGGGLDLERAIAELPDRARQVFVLHDVEGYRHEEIAAMLDIVPGTSKSQLHYARKQLKEALRS